MAFSNNAIFSTRTEICYMSILILWLSSISPSSLIDLHLSCCVYFLRSVITTISFSVRANCEYIYVYIRIYIRLNYIYNPIYIYRSMKNSYRRGHNAKTLFNSFTYTKVIQRYTSMKGLRDNAVIFPSKY